MAVSQIWNFHYLQRLLCAILTLLTNDSEYAGIVLDDGLFSERWIINDYGMASDSALYYAHFVYISNEIAKESSACLKPTLAVTVYRYSVMHAKVEKEQTAAHKKKV